MRKDIKKILWTVSLIAGMMVGQIISQLILS